MEEASKKKIKRTCFFTTWLPKVEVEAEACLEKKKKKKRV